MNPSISSLAKKLSTGAATINGESFAIRALTATETDRVGQLLPEPPLPMMKDFTKGSLAPQIPNENDPEWKAAQARWFRTICALHVAISAGLATADGKGWDPKLPDDELRAWCTIAAGELKSSASTRDIQRVWMQISDLGRTDGQARDQLIADIPEDAKLEGDEPWQLPARYGQTDGMIALRICERFGVNPFAAFGIPHDHPGLWSLLRAYQDIRIREDHIASV